MGINDPSHTTANFTANHASKRRRPRHLLKTRYYTTADLMRLFGLSNFTVSRWARTGKIPATRNSHGRGSHWYFPKAATDRLVTQRPRIDRADYYTTPDVIQLFDVKQTAILRWARNGSIPSTKRGHYRFYPKQAIDGILQHKPNPADFYQATQVAHLLALAPTTIKIWARQGILPTTRFPFARGDTWYYPKQEIDALKPTFNDFNPSNYYQTADLMRQFGVTRAAVSLWAKTGKLPVKRRGKFLFFPKDSVDHFRPKRIHPSR